MVNDAETGARNAEADKTNDPGYCQQQTRMWSGIPSRYPDASTAWRNTNDRYPGNRNPPRGAHVFWTGGSHGYGHVAMSLGGGKVRSTDAGGAGKVATVDLGWVESAWGLPYAGWAWDNNEVTIPHSTSGGGGGGGDDEMPDYDHGGSKTALKIKAGEWKSITWQNATGAGNFIEGQQGVKIGGRPYSAVLHITCEAPKGSTIRMRTIEWDPDAKKVTETNPQTEFTATGGNSAATHAQNGGVAKDKRLQFEVTCTQDMTVTAADAVVLSWK